MLCRRPYMQGNVPFGCGQCLPCRINRRRLWSWRMFLESLCHDASCFVTLTYDDEHLPPGGTLQPQDLRNWLKRFRKALAPTRVRFYAVGEYGDQTERPHYHAIVFGVGPEAQLLVHQTWGKGMVSVYECTQATCQYVAGYVVKKMTSAEDGRLGGRLPEFSRQSNRPGIGAAAMVVLADQLHTPGGAEIMAAAGGDVPHKIMVGRRSVPLGRYLRQRLRVEMGMPEHVKEKIKAQFGVQRSAEVLALWKASEAVDPRSAVVEANLGRIQSTEVRSKLRQRRVL